MTDPSLDDIVKFVREFAAIGSDHPITAETRLDADLGITGDDGDELLEQAAKRFGAALATPHEGYRTTFALGPNEYLFGSEGFDPFGMSWLIRRIKNEPRPVVRDLTVAQLHEAILRTKTTGNAV
jgi:hypothetical protein